MIIMKKSILLLLFVQLCWITSFGQAPRRVLIEEATNASCIPCAAQNPAFDALLNQNREHIAVVKYHASWPGYDPMYNHNTTDNGARISYYGINSVPRGVMDGTYNNMPSTFTQALINQYVVVPSPYEIDMYHYLSEDQDTIYAIMRIKAAQDINEEGLKAHIAVVENHIHFNSAPGSNGETDFYDVLKKLLPSRFGTAIPAIWQTGDYLILMESWKLENVYDIDELDVIGFVQDNDSKQVRQSGTSNDAPFDALFTHDVSMIKVGNLTETNCMGYMAPEITFANFGSEALTSVNIVCSVNGEQPIVYPWTGNLGYLKTTKIQLPQLGFSLLNENELNVYLENPNGYADQYAKNDTLTVNFEAAMETPYQVNLMIKLDNNPDEITWEITDPEGSLIFSGGPYTQAGATILEELVFETQGCYLFKIFDTGGDGLLAPGFFALYYGSGTQVIVGSQFGSMQQGQFHVDGYVGIQENLIAGSVQVFPNPVEDFGIIQFSDLIISPVSVEIVSVSGQVVKVFNDLLPEPATKQIFLPLSDVEKGLYLIRVKIKNSLMTCKIAVID